jgi:hypothetical protein
MPTSATSARNVSTVAAVVGILAAGVAAQPPADLADVIARVGERVEQYYRRAQSIVCVETVTLQPLTSSFSPDDHARVLEYELRIEWNAANDGDVAREANVMRQLLKINGRRAKPNAEPGCLDPKAVSPEPLAFLLAPKRDEYLFAWNRVARSKDGRTLTVDYRSRAVGSPEITWRGDCVSFELPGRSRGRLSIDATTHDVLRVDEQLIGQFDYRLPREHNPFGGNDWWVIERADSSIRYRPVSFRDPDEIVLLPESIESFQVIRGAGVPRLRTVQRFSNYKRFMTAGRVVKEQ